MVVDTVAEMVHTPLCPLPSSQPVQALEGSEHNLLVFEQPQRPAHSHVSPCQLNGCSSAGISVVSE